MGEGWGSRAREPERKPGLSTPESHHESFVTRRLTRAPIHIFPAEGQPLSIHQAWRLFLHLEETASEFLTLRQEAEGQGCRPGGSCQSGTLPWGQAQGHAVILVYTISRGMQSKHPPRTTFSLNHKVRQWGCQVKQQLMSVD